MSPSSLLTSTKNKGRKRDLKRNSSKKGNQWHFGMKAHIGADAASGRMHCMRATCGNVHDVTEGSTLLRGDETVACGDTGFQSMPKRPDGNATVAWHIAMRPGKRRAPAKTIKPMR